MRKVLVFDVAASARGALTILNSFYQHILNEPDIEWVFVLSSDYVESADNVSVKKYAWVKKSWLHRMFFDYFVAHRIAGREKADVLLSLQNINVPLTAIKQVTYIHQAIPFSDVKFTFRQNKLEWFYQNIIGRFIYRSIKRSSAVAVQTNWMKQAVVQKTGIEENRILIVTPDVDCGNAGSYKDDENSRKRFFYPSAYASYKNHRLLMEAIGVLADRGVRDFEVILTVNEGELPDSDQFGKIVRCVGTLPYGQVQELYRNSTVVFPSVLETYGLPLAEARCVGARILAADMPYAREVLDGYANALFFNVSDRNELADLMYDTIENRIVHHLTQCKPEKEWRKNSSWGSLIEILKVL